jgi:hypothetical protein
MRTRLAQTASDAETHRLSLVFTYRGFSNWRRQPKSSSDRNRSSPLAQATRHRTEIAANRRASASFWALVPKMEAIYGGGLIFPREGRVAHLQGNRSEAADGVRFHHIGDTCVET